jgi:hypothetical protein
MGRWRPYRPHGYCKVARSPAASPGGALSQEKAMKKTILFLATLASALTLGGCAYPHDDNGVYMDPRGHEGSNMERHDGDRRDGNYRDDNREERVDPRRGS